MNHRTWYPVVCGDVAFIPLTKGKWAAVDVADVSLVTGVGWHATWSPPDLWYARTWRMDRMHRVIMGLGPDDPSPDHINGNGLDNRRSNLREATRSQQMQNRGTWGESGYKGVCRQGAHWSARIQVGGKRWTIGVFDTEEQAAAAYDEAARSEHREFARLNLPVNGKAPDQATMQATMADLAPGEPGDADSAMGLLRAIRETQIERG